MSMVETKDIAEQPKEKSLPAQLKDKQSNFHAALPAHMPAERFARVVLTAIQNNPALANANRASLWNACMRAAQDGLLPDGRDGALVIYNTKDGKDANGRDVWVAKVQWMPMIGGIRKKVRNSGEIKDWNAQVVHAKDEFEFELGDTPFIKHKPYMDGEPGPVIAAYSIAQFKSGELSREVMTRAQIEKVRSVSRSKDKGPWVDWYEEMCRKTVARRHSKSLPMSSDLDDLIRRDDELYDLEGKSDKQQIGPPLKSLGARLGVLAGEPETEPENGAIAADDNPPSKHEAEAQDSPAPSEAPEPAGGVPPGPAEATPQGPLEGAAVSPPGAAAPSDPEADRRARVAEIHATGDARAQSGTAALRNFLDELRKDGEDGLVTGVRKSLWNETARAVDASREKGRAGAQP